MASSLQLPSASVTPRPAVAFPFAVASVVCSYLSLSRRRQSPSSPQSRSSRRRRSRLPLRLSLHLPFFSPTIFLRHSLTHSLTDTRGSTSSTLLSSSFTVLRRGLPASPPVSLPPRRLLSAWDQMDEAEKEECETSLRSGKEEAVRGKEGGWVNLQLRAEPERPFQSSAAAAAARAALINGKLAFPLFRRSSGGGSGGDGGSA